MTATYKVELAGVAIYLNKDGTYIIVRRVMDMKDEKKKPEKKSPKHTEKLSRKDIEELMNMNMPTYTRHNGAIRRKR